MTENQDSKALMSKNYPCWRMCGRPGSGIFWGIILIVGGLFWLAKQANWFPSELTEMFWPGALIFAGIWIIASVFMSKGERHLKE